MKEWFESLAPRERLIVIFGGLLVVPILLWAIAWEPMSTSLDALRTDVRNDNDLLSWMQQSAQKIQQNQSQSGRKPQNQHVSLINAIESTARQSGLRKSITSLDPQGDNKINIKLQNVAFNDMVIWQGRLEKEFSIQTRQLNISPTDKVGLVNARIQYIR